MSDVLQACAEGDEDVLIVRRHLDTSLGQGLRGALQDEKTIWKERYRSVVDRPGR